MDNEPRFMKMLGHYSDPFYPWILIGTSLVPVLAPGIKENTVYSVISALASGFICFMLFSGLMVHVGKFCDRCAHLMLLLPDKSADMAKREKPVLRLYHRVMDTALFNVRFRGRCVPIPLLGGLLIVALVGDFILTRFLGARTYGADLSHLFVFALPMGAMLWALYRHRRLQSWCPYCPRDEDDDDVIVPDPDPAISR